MQKKNHKQFQKFSEKRLTQSSAKCNIYRTTQIVFFRAFLHSRCEELLIAPNIVCCFEYKSNLLQNNRRTIDFFNVAMESIALVQDFLVDFHIVFACPV